MKQKFYLLVSLAKLFTVANLLRYLEIEIQYFQICEGETLQGREPSSRNQFRDWKDWENLLVYSDLQTVQCILILCIISPASRLYLYHESSHHNQDLSAAMLEGQTFNIDTALEIWPTHIHSTAESSIQQSTIKRARISVEVLIEVELILKPMINCHGREAAVYKVCHSVMSVVLPILTFRGVSLQMLYIKA